MQAPPLSETMVSMTNEDPQDEALRRQVTHSRHQRGERHQSLVVQQLTPLSHRHQLACLLTTSLQHSVRMTSQRLACRRARYVIRRDDAVRISLLRSAAAKYRPCRAAGREAPQHKVSSCARKPPALLAWVHETPVVGCEGIGGERIFPPESLNIPGCKLNSIC